MALEKRHAGFYATTTLNVDAGALEALRQYELVKAQETCLSQARRFTGIDGPAGTGELFVLFVSHILYSLAESVYRENLFDRYPSVRSMLHATDLARPGR